MRHHLAALLLCALATAGSARHLWPRRARESAEPCRHFFGVHRGGSLRVLCRDAPRARAMELLTQIGGPTAATNLELRDGEMLVVEGGAMRRALLPAAVRVTAGLPLELNRASAADLQELPRVGKALAGRIVLERERRGGFRRLGDLRAVRGVGVATLRRLEPFLTVTPEP